jgi:hypothetical protein
VGSTLPIGGSLAVTNTLMNLPIDAGDTISIWAGVGYNTYTYEGGVNGYLTAPNDWVDQNLNNVPAPVISIGQGFFYSAGSGDTEVWKQGFSF